LLQRHLLFGKLGGLAGDALVLPGQVRAFLLLVVVVAALQLGQHRLAALAQLVFELRKPLPLGRERFAGPLSPLLERYGELL
jgi:hypothetical protein